MRSLIWMGTLLAVAACGSVDKSDPDAAIALSLVLVAVAIVVTVVTAKISERSLI